MNLITLSPASLKLLLRLIDDAPNWSGQPLLDISSGERGNLTDLKRKGLVKTTPDEGVEYVKFLFQDKQTVTDGIVTCELRTDGDHYPIVSA